MRPSVEEEGEGDAVKNILMDSSGWNFGVI
jgi:hypothetical protein